jgi:hypothetical protein
MRTFYVETEVNFEVDDRQVEFICRAFDPVIRRSDGYQVSRRQDIPALVKDVV